MNTFHKSAIRRLIRARNAGDRQTRVRRALKWCALSAGVLLIGLSACKRAMPPANPTADPHPRCRCRPSMCRKRPCIAAANAAGHIRRGEAGNPAFDNLPGVHWRDAKPLGNPDSHSSETTHTRSGSTLLTGFGDVDVPDGKVGEEAGIKRTMKATSASSSTATRPPSCRSRCASSTRATTRRTSCCASSAAAPRSSASPADARSTTAPPRRTHKTTCSSGSPSPAPPCRCLRKPTSMKRAAISLGRRTSCSTAPGRTNVSRA